jgi:hypothetical protein
VQDDLGRHELDALVLDGFEDCLGAAAKCASPLLIGHGHFGDIPPDFGVDHSCATDLAPRSPPGFAFLPKATRADARVESEAHRTDRLVFRGLPLCFWRGEGAGARFTE